MKIRKIMEGVLGVINHNMVRCNICKENGGHHIENTEFEGKHYVECYLLKRQYKGRNIATDWSKSGRLFYHG